MVDFNPTRHSDVKSTGPHYRISYSAYCNLYFLPELLHFYTHLFCGSSLSTFRFSQTHEASLHTAHFLNVRLYPVTCRKVTLVRMYAKYGASPFICSNPVSVTCMSFISSTVSKFCGFYVRQRLDTGSGRSGVWHLLSEYYNLVRRLAFINILT
jgi:hypothetical protein